MSQFQIEIGFEILKIAFLYEFPQQWLKVSCKEAMIDVILAFYSSLLKVFINQEMLTLTFSIKFILTTDITWI